MLYTRCSNFNSTISDGAVCSSNLTQTEQNWQVLKIVESNVEQSDHGEVKDTVAVEVTPEADCDEKK